MLHNRIPQKDAALVFGVGIYRSGFEALPCHRHPWGRDNKMEKKELIRGETVLMIFVEKKKEKKKNTKSQLIQVIGGRRRYTVMTSMVAMVTGGERMTTCCCCGRSDRETAGDGNQNGVETKTALFPK